MDADRHPHATGGAAGRHYVTRWVGPPPPTSDPLGVAQSGSSHEKSRLAGESKLDDEVVDLLLHSGDSDVAAILAGNGTLSTSALERLAELHPEHRHRIGQNPEAPVHLKDAVPIGDHVNYALLRYYEQRGAADDVRRAIYRRYVASPQPGGPLLGDVWREITSAT